MTWLIFNIEIDSKELMMKINNLRFIYQLVQCVIIK